MTGTQAFLSKAGWANAASSQIAGDASDRRYERLRLGDKSAVLMIAPPETCGPIAPFLNMAGWLRSAGLSAPDIFLADPRSGLILMEDLGDGLIARLTIRTPGNEPDYFAQIARMLWALHQNAPSPDLPVYGPAQMADMIAPVFEFFAPGTPKAVQVAVRDGFAEALETHTPDTPVTVLRDCHGENLLWLPDRDGPARIGLLDFQDALRGHPAYDMASLIQDARRDVPQKAVAAAVTTYLDLSGGSDSTFQAALALQGAQRHIRILGVFSRLAAEKHKPGYLAFLPRVWTQLQTCLAHPAARGIRAALADYLPCPKPQRQRIAHG